MQVNVYNNQLNKPVSFESYSMGPDHTEFYSRETDTLIGLTNDGVLSIRYGLNINSVWNGQNLELLKTLKDSLKNN